MAQDFPRVITIDANFLVANVDRSTSEDDKRRIAHFLNQAEQAKAKLIIPTPALAEYLVRADRAGLETMERLERKSFVVVAPFDRAAAYECAQMDAAALGRGDKRDGHKGSWQKIKIDRQIVATAKVFGTQFIISDDDDVRGNAMRSGIRVARINELSLPVEQGKLPLSRRGKSDIPG